MPTKLGHEHDVINQPVDNESEVRQTWCAYKDTEHAGIDFGRACYEYRNEHRSAGGAGSKGKGLVQLLDELSCPKSTAYYWIERYEVSIGNKAEGIETICRACGGIFSSKKKCRKHFGKAHPELLKLTAEQEEKRRLRMLEVAAKRAAADAAADAAAAVDQKYAGMSNREKYKQMAKDNGTYVNSFRAAQEANVEYRAARKASATAELEYQLNRLLPQLCDGGEHSFIRALDGALAEDKNHEYVIELLGMVIEKLGVYKAKFSAARPQGKRAQAMGG